jgi:hypothetical protein
MLSLYANTNWAEINEQTNRLASCDEIVYELNFMDFDELANRLQLYDDDSITSMSASKWPTTCPRKRTSIGS